eukprot:CAMPEP_0206423518 /NCGR_PEP_ID=MMETSP0324_2-20121206/2723_1 /ASSEMBLY_ACC=CAM_ASM_000836 /TAXON_ID=2866 /ORGANISM="Crypthecodinium cohnii, Strain Seligo" /LENGTH=138 /DNA_ID=CAMNT_0053888083 /DNA_START=595 /DNA_END=1011 /DNA_ORIENTATION=-
MLGHTAHVSGTAYRTFEGIDDETDSRGETFYALLYDVVPVLILDALKHMALELPYEKHLLVDGHRVKCLLYDPASVHVQRELQNLPHQLLGQNPSLFIGTEFEELLDDIVAEHVHGQGVHSLKYRLEGQGFFLIRSVL